MRRVEANTVRVERSEWRERERSGNCSHRGPHDVDIALDGGRNTGGEEGNGGGIETNGGGVETNGGGIETNGEEGHTHVQDPSYTTLFPGIPASSSAVSITTAVTPVPHISFFSTFSLESTPLLSKISRSSLPDLSRLVTGSTRSLNGTDIAPGTWPDGRPASICQSVQRGSMANSKVAMIVPPVLKNTHLASAPARLP